MAAGVFAAVGAIMIGPRTGKFNRDGSSSMIPGHNVTLTSVGAIILVLGLMAYITSGGAFRFSPPDIFILGVCLWNVLLAGASATTAAIMFSQLRYGKPDIILVLTGLLGGVVSLAAGGAALAGWPVVITGAVAGIIVPLTVVAIDLRARVDDPCAAIAPRRRRAHGEPWPSDYSCQMYWLLPAPNRSAFK